MRNCQNCIPGPRGLSFVLLMKTSDNHTGPVNLGNPNECTILELAERIIALTGSKSRIVFQPLPQDDPERRQPDISKAKQFLGWEPRIQLQEGLTRTIKYFEDLLTDQGLRASLSNAPSD